MDLRHRLGFRNQWEEVVNTDIPQINVPFQGDVVGFDRFKLYIYIPGDSPAFYAMLPRLRNLLDEATQRKIITGYKYLTVSLHDSTAENKEWEIIRSLPFRLYLHNEPTEENLSDVLMLCLKIEKIFENEEKLEDTFLERQEKAYVKLSGRFAIRQTAFDEPEYIPAHDARAKELAHQVKKSKSFQFLQAGLTKSEITKNLDEKMLEAKSDLPPPEVLKNINFTEHPYQKIKKLVEYFLNCKDGQALFIHDYVASIKILRRCLLEPEMRLIQFAPGILNVHPALAEYAVLECPEGKPLESLLIGILQNNYLLTFQESMDAKQSAFPNTTENIFNYPKIRDLILSSDFDLKLKINKQANLGNKKVVIAFLSLGISVEPDIELPPHENCTELMQNYQVAVKRIEMHDDAYQNSLIDSHDDSSSTLKSVINFLKFGLRTNTFFSGIDSILNKLLKSTNEADAKLILEIEIKKQLENDIPDPTYLSKLFFIHDKFDPMFRLRHGPILHF